MIPDVTEVLVLQSSSPHHETVPIKHTICFPPISPCRHISFAAEQLEHLSLLFSEDQAKLAKQRVLEGVGWLISASYETRPAWLYQLADLERESCRLLVKDRTEIDESCQANSTGCRNKQSWMPLSVSCALQTAKSCAGDY